MNTPTNYTVVYDCLDSKGNVIKSGKIIAKRKYTEFEALAGTENYLKSKKDAFKDIFGAGNPFGL